MSTAKLIDELISTTQILVLSKSYCPYCIKIKKTLESLSKTFTSLELDQRKDGSDIQSYVTGKTGQRTVPMVYVNQKFVGGRDDFHRILKNGEFEKLLLKA